jgi:hypothetical protein
MNVERGGAATSVIDVLDRVLDKGVVIDAWVRVSVVGIDLIALEARVVVASIETFLRYSDRVQRTPRELTVKQLAQGVQVQLAYGGGPAVVPTDFSDARRRRDVRRRLEPIGRRRA